MMTQRKPVRWIASSAALLLIQHFQHRSVAPCEAFAPRTAAAWHRIDCPPTLASSTARSMFFASDSGSKKSQPGPDMQQQQQQAPVPAAATTATDANVDLIISDQEGFLNAVGGFLVDSFWLNSEHHQLEASVEDVDPDVKMSLVVEQASDLQDRYGEVMGRRLLDACVIAALDKETRAIVGAVTIKETLLDKQVVMDSEEAEATCKSAVAGLGPKQRRTYKNASARTIADELLSPDTTTICVLSNLAVSPTARRRGIAKMLCDEAEALASDWGYSRMHLLVEEANAAARSLYENKLGYGLEFRKDSEAALRANLQDGTFDEVFVPTLVLSKPV